MLTPETLHLLEGFLWTRRLVLATVASFYDPSGLICPFLIKFELMLRSLCLDSGIEWDSALAIDKMEKWKQLVTELVLSPGIIVPRTVRPKNAIGEPELIAISDGSLLAFCAAIYARWEVEISLAGPWSEGLHRKRSWDSNLLLAKARVSPLAGTTPPRSEMNGHVVANRLVNISLRALRIKPTKLTFILDSECTIAAVRSEHGRLTAYLANRRAEVLETWDECKRLYPDVVIEPLLHVAGPLNVADMGTRDRITAEDVGIGSVWQKGPAFLANPKEDWPVSEEIGKDVPIEELSKKHDKIFISSVNILKISKLSKASEKVSDKEAEEAGDLESIDDQSENNYGVLKYINNLAPSIGL